ncbi:Chromosomal replication initiator protein DnaA [Eubacterium plexicaudatum ASF492]|nr:Chromosomal replication initiator protein DnaA [Eubacterium plexicaudatum ASF492]
MTTLEERFRSRFQWGCMADIGSPDYETRMAILRRKEEMDNIKFDDEIIKYIATNIKSNIRELEGALNRLMAFSRLTNVEITIDTAKEQLESIINPDLHREITPQLIIEIVAEHFQKTPQQLISKSRSSDIVRPRQIAMYLCKNMTGSSLAGIGEILGGRDHSTIIHGIEKIEAEYQSNESTQNLIETIRKKINPN